MRARLPSLPTATEATILRILGAWARWGRTAAGAAPRGPAPAAAPPSARPVAAERRADARIPLDRGALLDLDGRRRVAVILLDLSAGGAGVQMRGAAPVPGHRGRLIVDTAMLPVRVTRAEDGRVGLAFLASGQETASALRRIVASTGFVGAA